MMPEYTGCSNRNELGVHVVKSDFTAHISKFHNSPISSWKLKSPSDPLTLIVNEETEHALATELGVNGHGK